MMTLILTLILTTFHPVVGQVYEVDGTKFSVDISGEGYILYGDGVEVGDYIIANMHNNDTEDVTDDFITDYINISERR